MKGRRVILASKVKDPYASSGNNECQEHNLLSRVLSTIEYVTLKTCFEETKKVV
jgi:hypothetical protein